MSVKIVYCDVDFQIKKDLSGVSTESETQSGYMDSELFNFVAIPSERQATLERDFWRLDGSYALPDVENKMNMAFFSKSMSGDVLSEYGYNLSESVSLSFVFGTTVNVSNLTFTFDSPDFCTHLYVEGFSDAEQTTSIFGADVFPDRDFYTHEFGIEYEVLSLKFTFYSMNKPNRFLKIFGIDFGKSYSFVDEDVYDISILKETSLISDSLPIGTSNIGLNIRNSQVEEFKKYKPVFIYKDDKIERVHYVTNVDETGFNRMDLYCSDALWLLDEIDNSMFGFIPQTKALTYGEIDSPFIIYSNYYEGDTSTIDGYDLLDYRAPHDPRYWVSKFVSDFQKYISFPIIYTKDLEFVLFKETYNEISKKELLLKQVFASQICVRCLNNGFVQLSNQIENRIPKKISQKKLFNQYQKITKNKVNQISYNVHTIKKNYVSDSISLDSSSTAGTSYLSSDNDLPLVFTRAHFYNLKSLFLNFNQNTQNEIRMEFGGISDGSGGHRKTTIYGYTITTTTERKTVDLEYVDANSALNVAEVADNSFLTTENESRFINAISEYYKHNSVLEFDMILEDENEGDWLELDMRDKIYTGRIEKIEYTMQGKKIGTVTMRIYDEVTVNG